MTKDLLTVFASAIGGAAVVVALVQIGVRLFAPQAFNKAGQSMGVQTTHDSSPTITTPIIRTIRKPRDSALSATDPFANNPQADLRYGSEKQEHWSTSVVTQQK